ncbi:glycosyltransferase [Streptococcus suis]
MKIAIVMATFNGQDFIEEQLISIINQSYTDWSLIIRDDLSTDDTLKILRKYEMKDDRIKVISDGRNLGQCQNFSYLMSEVKEFDYVFFADQDDVWKLNKLEEMVGYVIKYDSGEPLIVYTNYAISDSKLSILSNAYNMDMSTINNIQNRLFVQNWLMGCTMCINNKLLKMSLDIPLFIDNHDEWISLVCSANSGNIVYLDFCSIIHRIHVSNVTTSSETRSMRNRLDRLIKYPQFYKRKNKYDKLKLENLSLRFGDTKNIQSYNKFIFGNRIDRLKSIIFQDFKPYNFVNTVLYIIFSTIYK